MKRQRLVVAVSSLLGAVALAVAFTLGFFAPASADDGAVEGEGGAIHAMTEHPSIVMQSEAVHVRISAGAADVHCAFMFHNDGPATKVKMGFPESGGGEIDSEHPRGFLSFKSWVDGNPVPTRIEKGSAGPGSYRRWRTKHVSFAPGQTRRVEVRYRQGLGGSSDGSLFFTYLLTTGASWKGKIGHAKVVIRFVNVPGYATYDGGVLDGTTIVRERRDFEPGKPTPAPAAEGGGKKVAPDKKRRVHKVSHDVSISFYPAAPPLIVDGKRLKFDLKTPPLPRAISGQFFVPIKEFAEQIGAETAWDPKAEAVTFKRGAKSTTVRLHGGGGPGMLTLWRNHGVLVVGANEVIQALGGTVEWRSPQRLVATLPPIAK